MVEMGLKLLVVVGAMALTLALALFIAWLVYGDDESRKPPRSDRDEE